MPASRILFSCSALMLLLAGCAVGPDHRPAQAPAPADWSAWHGGSPALLGVERNAAPAGTASGDWKAFGDPLLDRLLALSLEANHDLKTAALRFAQSRVQRTAAASQQGSQLGASGGINRQRQSETGAATRMIDALGSSVANRDQLIRNLSEPYNLYQAGFDASWEIDLWGRVRRSIEAADADSGASAALLRQAQQSVQAEVARSYFELRGAQRELRLARADVAAAAEALELVQARAEGGLVTDLDPTRQRTQLAELKARLPMLLQQEAQAMNQITLLAGALPGALNAELAEPPSDGTIDTRQALAAPQLPDLALGLPSDLVRRRPTLPQRRRNCMPPPPASAWPWPTSTRA